jgi:hypothetical protein
MCRSATQKIDTTALFYCTKHGQNPIHPTDKCFTLKNRMEKFKRNSSSAFNKRKSFRKSKSSYKKMSLDHITVKTTDEYETQTDNSDRPSENKWTKFTNTRHINPELKILMHSQQQLKSKISYGALKTINRSEWASPMFTVSKTYQTLRSITDLKEKKRLLQNVSNPKSPKNKYTNCDGFNYNCFGHRHGILQNHNTR